MNLMRKILSRLAIALLLLPGFEIDQGLAQQPAPAITVAPIILVEPMVETPVPIQIAGAPGLPRTTFLRVKGLPPQSTLSNGHYVSPGTWALPIATLADLKLTVPLATTGRTDLHLALMSIEGTVLAETKATLAITAAQIGSVGQTQPPAPAVSQLPSTAALAPQTAPDAAVTVPQPTLVRPPTPATARQALPAQPTLKPEDHDRATKLLKRGDSEFASGDVAAARLLYQRAADIGLGDAALALGSTYDPGELARRGVKGLQGDAETAHKWYARAQELGVASAAERLSALGR